MKKFNLLLLALVSFAVTATAQCTIDSMNVPAPGDVYPAASALPHLMQHVAYDQTVQGRIQNSFDTTLLTFQFTVNIDSLRMDSIEGMPNGITFTKSPNVVKGGRPGCVEFSGTTTSPGGVYNLTAYGTAWGHATQSTLGIDTPVTYSGNLNPFSPFGGYYLTVDTPAGGNGPQVTLNVHQPLCYGETGSIAAVASGGNGSFSYIWNNSQTSDSIYGLTANTYSVTVTSNSETATASATITAAPAQLTGSISEVKFGCDSAHATLTVSGGTSPYSYVWSTGSHSSTATLLPHVETQVTVTDAHACTRVDSTVFVCTGIFSTYNSSALNLHLYPNPASGVVHLTATMAQSSQVEIKIYGITGQVLYSRNQSVSGILNSDIDVQNLAPGVYIIELTSEGLSGRQRFVVER